MKAIWLPIEGYEDLYEVSNTGKVRSLCGRYGKNRILKQSSGSKGYLIVTLCGKGPQKTVNVHRLVAKAFIPNPENHPQINHMDEDPANNRADNLEWCTAEYNNAYGTARIRIVETKSRPIEQLTLDGKTIAVYRSTRIAAELLGINRGTLKDCIRKGSPCSGYYWKYSDHTF